MFKSRRRPLIAGAFIALLAAGAAFAYWTAGGSGTGSATTGTVNALTAVQTSTVAGMYPGGPDQTLTGNFNNPNTGPVYVSTVTASIASVSKAAGAPDGTCDASDYTLSGAAMTVDAEIDPGTAKGAWTGAKIKFNNKAGTNQDACKGATVSLKYTIN